MEHHNKDEDGEGPTYRTILYFVWGLFASACMVIGTGVGWWATNLSGKVADLSAAVVERREQVAGIREQISGIREKISDMEAGHIAQNKALADLERQVYLLERGRR